MTDLFGDQLVGPLLEREGGSKYTNIPGDRGGPTRWGITAAKLGEYRGLGRPATAEEVQNLQRPEAVEIYRRDYFTRPGYDRIAALSVAIATELFDTGVNMGVGWPGKWLQRSLNLCNRQGSDYADVGVDGAIGPGTAGALQKLIAVRGQAGAEGLMLKCLNGFQFEHYVQITEAGGANSDQEKFFCGWIAQRIGL